MAFTTIPSAGAKLRASVLSALITEVRPLEAYKSADETVNNSAALQNDDALFVSVAANTRYDFRLTALYISNSTPDIKFAWTFPTGLTMRYSFQGYTAGVMQDFYQIQTDVVAVDGNGGNLAAVMEGTVVVAGTAGTLQLQWAQNTANASDTKVLIGSSLRLWQVI